MKYIENTLDEPRRVDDGKGRLLRVAPHSIVAVPDDADTDHDGLQESSKDAFSEFVAKGNPSSERTKDQTVMAHVTQANRAARLMTTAVPLQEVIGDSDAPHGPDNGVVTTKQLAAAESAEAKRAFADHEQIEVKDGMSDVEVRQAEITQEVDEATRDLQQASSPEEASEAVVKTQRGRRKNKDADSAPSES